MVTGDLFDERVAIVFKQDEVPHVIQETAQDRRSHERLSPTGIPAAADRLPRHEPFFVGRKRTDTCRNPIANDQSHVVGQQVGNFVFVSLQLRVGLPHIGRFIRRVLQLDDRAGKPLTKNHHVGPASLLGSRDAELVDDQQVVVVRVLEVDDLSVDRFLAILSAVFNFDAGWCRVDAVLGCCVPSWDDRDWRQRARHHRRRIAEDQDSVEPPPRPSDLSRRQLGSHPAPDRARRARCLRRWRSPSPSRGTSPSHS